MDIINRIEARFPTNIKLYPVSVQGANAVNELIAGLKYFENNQVDTLIIARGGGGIEDLMPFNDENLVREVYKFKTPIISAIGHETDFTLLDFVADLRAATPTAAAEQAVPELKNLLEKKIFLEKSLNQIISNFINNNLRILKNMNSIFNPRVLRKIIYDNNKNLSLVMKSIHFNFSSFIKMKYIELRRLGSLVSTLNIDDILKKGFVLIRDKNMRIVKNSKILKKNKNINIKFYDDDLFAEIKIKNERS